VRRKVVFILLVCFFTVFGGGQVYRWAVVCQDKEGHVYEIDTRSIEHVAEGELRFRVRTSLQGRSRVDDWHLKPGTRTLSLNGGPEELVISGSVASQAILFLQRRDKLQPNLSPTDGIGLE
jgi:hypothetical protein